MTKNIELGYARLHFNIHYPSIEECWLDGYEAAAGDMREEQNPYSSHTREHQYWADGWWAGFYGEAPLFDLNDYQLMHEKTNRVASQNPTYMAIQHQESDQQPLALLENLWSDENKKLWIKRVAQIILILLATAVAYELAELAA